MTYPPTQQGSRTDASPATPNSHADDHTTLDACITSIVTELGTGPKGASADLTARLSTLDTTTAGKLAKASNLSDLADAPTARSNLGLGSLATKSAVVSADITDGTIVDGDI